jgi:hypothetical protein
MRYFTFLLLLIALPLRAQVFMTPFENAANLAMGSATVGLQQPINGVTNPAQLAYAPKIGILAYSAVPYSISGWQSHGFQVTKSVQQRSGFSLDILHSGIEGYAEQRAQLSYGRKLSEKFALGGGIQGMRVSADEYGSRSALTFLVGITARVLPRFTIGATIQNPAPQRVAGETIANILKIGGVWQPSDLFLISTEIAKDLERPAQIKAGVEYRPISLVRLRLGVRSYPARTSFGAGFALKNGLHLDFGSEWHPVLGFTPAAMVSWTRSK